MEKPPLVTSMHNRFSAIYTLELAEPGKDWQHRIKAISAIKFVLLLLQVESQTKKPVFIYPYLHWLAYSSCSRIPSLPLEIWEGTFFKTNTEDMTSHYTPLIRTSRFFSHDFLSVLQVRAKCGILNLCVVLATPIVKVFSKYGRSQNDIELYF